MSPEYTINLAVNIVWLVWYVPWIAAVVWSAKTKTQMGTDVNGLHRILSGLGAVLLFFVPANSGGPFLGSAFLGLFARQLWHEPQWLAWSLVGLTIASFCFCWWARLHLGRLWSGFVTLKEGHRVVDTGPYALVRHPIYSGVIFAALTTALIRANAAGLLGFVLLAAGFTMTAKIEERFLREQLGVDAYDSYSRRVAMLVPLVR
ncbi:MAG TPA: isoprenylcysteine carboxylmethyltransferase family protein [Rhizomicrobium sp.]